jgi:hypothetical protein
MKLSDALSLFEARIAKSEGGTLTMTPEDLVKYMGEQIALAETEGDAGAERLAAVKALIEAVKSAEATGATSFEVKPFVAAVKAEPVVTEDKDPVLEALAGLAATVKGLADSLSTAVKPAVVEPTATEDKGGEGAEVDKSAGGAEPPVEPTPTPKAPRVAWPADLNRAR